MELISPPVPPSYSVIRREVCWRRGLASRASSATHPRDGGAYPGCGSPPRPTSPSPGKQYGAMAGYGRQWHGCNRGLMSVPRQRASRGATRMGRNGRDASGRPGQRLCLALPCPTRPNPSTPLRLGSLFVLLTPALAPGRGAGWRRHGATLASFPSPGPGCPLTCPEPSPPSRPPPARPTREIIPPPAPPRPSPLSLFLSPFLRSEGAEGAARA